MGPALPTASSTRSSHPSNTSCTMSDPDTGFAGRSLCRLAQAGSARFKPLVRLC